MPDKVYNKDISNIVGEKVKLVTSCVHGSSCANES